MTFPFQFNFDAEGFFQSRHCCCWWYLGRTVLDFWLCSIYFDRVCNLSNAITIFFGLILFEYIKSNWSSDEVWLPNSSINDFGASYSHVLNCLVDFTYAKANHKAGKTYEHLNFLYFCSECVEKIATNHCYWKKSVQFGIRYPAIRVTSVAYLM